MLHMKQNNKILIHTNSQLENCLGLKISLGSKESLWSTLIGLFNVVSVTREREIIHEFEMGLQYKTMEQVFHG